MVGGGGAVEEADLGAAGLGLGGGGADRDAAGGGGGGDLEDRGFATFFGGLVGDGVGVDIQQGTRAQRESGVLAELRLEREVWDVEGGVQSLWFLVVCC